MYLSYSGFKQLYTCGFAYWCGYIANMKALIVDDRLGSLYGSIVGTLFEEFYRNKLWREPQTQKALMERVEPLTDEVIQRETSTKKGRPGGVLLWKGEGPGQNPKGMYASREELVADIRDAVPRGLRIIRHFRLLGRRAEAETKLDRQMDNGDTWAGRSDFIIERAPPHNDLIIVDGKGSKHRDRYVDPQQLQWYALLYWMKFHKIPDKLAFLFWRYEPHEAMDWIETSEEELKELAELIRDTMEGAKSGQKRLLPNAPPEAARDVFKPKANEQNCRFCEFGTKEVCPKGFAVKQTIEEKQAKQKSKK